MTFHSLEPGALRAKQVGNAIAGSLTLGVVIVANYASPIGSALPWALPVAIVMIGGFSLLEILSLDPRLHRSFRYSLTDRAVEIQRGVLVRSFRHIPYRQVLVVERRVGPILRKFELVSVRLKLADGSIDIYGVSEDAFEQIKSSVLEDRDDE